MIKKGEMRELDFFCKGLFLLKNYGFYIYIFFLEFNHQSSFP